MALTQIPALHVVYEGIAIVDSKTCPLYEYAVQRNADQDEVKRRAAAERKRIFDYVRKQLVTFRLWQEVQQRLESSYVPKKQLHDVLESSAAKIAGLVMQQVFDIIGDRRSNPDDRLKWIITKYRLENLEYLQEYLEFRSQHSLKDETGMLIQQLELRQDVHAALLAKGMEQRSAEVLLCRIDYLVDAAVCRREHPQVFREFLRS
jgi:hypothetical protein